MNTLVNQIKKVIWGEWFHSDQYSIAKSAVTTPLHVTTKQLHLLNDNKSIIFSIFDISTKKIDDLLNLKYSVLPNSTLLNFSHQP